ncbi:beta-mannosidase [Cohnella soli]|uniref:beta-mannosidase n=1 Tax=Cohnella soli TaxID=425005 RepID=A0ABW0HST5_9BACL
MIKTIDLNGAWLLNGIDESARKAPIAIEAQVPGHVHQDLEQAGLIPDPRIRKNADLCQWVEHMQWTYTKTFELAELSEGAPVLAFEGLDTFSDIYLNGIWLGTTDNMFCSYRFEVAGVLRLGTNEIQVKFKTIESSLSGKPYADYPAAFSNERVYVRRMQCTFGWDWVHRLVSYGIWKPVRLLFEPSVSIRDTFVYTRALDASGASLRYTLEVRRRTSEPVKARINIHTPDLHAVWQTEKPVYGDKLELDVSLREPQLWWPSGYGGQPLYIVETTLYSASGNEIETRSDSFGIRTVRIEQLKDQPGSPEEEMTSGLRQAHPQWDRNGNTAGSSFTLIVNGRPIFCKGANWVPADPFPSRISERHYEHLLQLAHDGHITLLRCWGGGIYESEAFWKSCDKLGILVCQDFMMACGSYPDGDTEWTSSLRLEFESAIRTLRQHPSLVWWNGDNENGLFDDEDNAAYPGRKIAETITGRLCAELDPSRPFTPTSPFGGSPNLSFTIGTSHHTGIMLEMFDYLRAHDLRDYREYFASFVSRFCSEFPMFGTPEKHTLLKFMTLEDLKDPAYEMLEYHTKNHPGLTDFSLFKVLLMLADKLMPPFSTVMEQIEKMSFVQHELTRLVVEAYRRQRHYASGILFWMYNDCWPASGWSLVDYYGYPKAGYYGLKAAAKPVISSIAHDKANGAFQFWVCSDKPEDIRGRGRLRVLSLDGVDHHAEKWSKEAAFIVPAGTSRQLDTIADETLLPLLDNRHILVMEIEGDFGADRSVWFNGLPSEMSLTPSGVQIVTQDDNSLVVSSEKFAKAVHLHGELVFTDNYFDLLPGETRTIGYHAIDGSKGHVKPTIELFSWN